MSHFQIYQLQFIHMAYLPTLCRFPKTYLYKMQGRSSSTHTYLVPSAFRTQENNFSCPLNTCVGVQH